MQGRKTRIAMILYNEGFVNFDYILSVLQGELEDMQSKRGE